MSDASDLTVFEQGHRSLLHGNCSWSAIKDFVALFINGKEEAIFYSVCFKIDGWGLKRTEGLVSA